MGVPASHKKLIPEISKKSTTPRLSEIDVGASWEAYLSHFYKGTGLGINEDFINCLTAMNIPKGNALLKIAKNYFYS